MINFDESALVRELAELPSSAMAAFALAAATRQLGNYERFARELSAASGQRPREIATQLWTDLSIKPIDRDAWTRNLDEVTNLIPEECDDWGIGHALADDSLSSLAYAIRCFLKADPQEAAWAARRAYESADQSAICVLEVQPGLPSTEVAIMSHPLVQRELSRQQRDLALLRIGSIRELQECAWHEELLTEREAARVVLG
jgi:uncharacterized protein YjaG (DUF416 family)